jgi:hypothetical protein
VSMGRMRSLQGVKTEMLLIVHFLVRVLHRC